MIFESTSAVFRAKDQCFIKSALLVNISQGFQAESLKITPYIANLKSLAKTLTPYLPN